MRILNFGVRYGSVLPANAGPENFIQGPSVDFGWVLVGLGWWVFDQKVPRSLSEYAWTLHDRVFFHMYDVNVGPICETFFEFKQ